MVAIWILALLVGVLLSVAGFLILVLRLRRGDIRQRYLLACGIGYVAFVSFALMEAMRPDLGDSAVKLAILLPAFAAIVVLVQEHRRGKVTRVPTSLKRHK